MIYPKCLYKTRDKTCVVKDEESHILAAEEGWKDVWTDKKPRDFDELKKKRAKDKAEKEEAERTEIQKQKTQIEDMDAKIKKLEELISKKGK
jgi:uncharacterized damage-inducible protein DinB